MGMAVLDWLQDRPLRPVELRPRGRMGHDRPVWLRSSLADGHLCDMAMLVLSAVFERTWGRRAGRCPETEYWTELIPTARKNYPDFLLMAEACWDREWELPCVFTSAPKQATRRSWSALSKTMMNHVRPSPSQEQRRRRLRSPRQLFREPGFSTKDNLKGAGFGPRSFCAGVPTNIRTRNDTASMKLSSRRSMIRYFTTENGDCSIAQDGPITRAFGIWRPGVGNRVRSARLSPPIEAVRQRRAGSICPGKVYRTP